MMEIHSAEFITSASHLDGYMRASAGYEAPEVCFVGRSNVGKSSFINMICRRSALARTSSLPGRTRLINLFSVNNGKLILVDLPGYAVEYRVSTVGGGYLPWVRNYNTVNSDGYAGITGKPIDRVQIRIVKV